MRLAGEFRSAIAREGPLARAAIAAFFVAAVIYGGGKGDGGNGEGGDGGDSGGGGDRGGVLQIPRPGGTGFAPSATAGATNDVFRWTSFTIDGDNFGGTLAWPATNLEDYAAIDIFHKESLTNALWRWIHREEGYDPEDLGTAVTFDGDELPYWEEAVADNFHEYTNEVSAPFGVTYTNIIAYVPAATNLVAGFFRAANQHDSDGDGAPDAVETSLGLDPGDPDMDGDGVPDGRELAFGASPLLTDSDGDGLDDGVEVSWGAASTNGAALWIDTSAATNRVVIFTDTDDGYAELPMPFPLRLVGAAMTNLSVNANGLVGFSSRESAFGSGRYNNYRAEYIPMSSIPCATIAAFWDNLRLFPEMGSAISLVVVGSDGGRTGVVEFAHVGFRSFGTNDFVSFQVQFSESETNVVRVVFSEASGRGCGESATLGALSTYDDGVEYSFNDDGSVFPGLAIEYYFGIGTDPAKADTDDDGLDDPVELALGTDPLDGDTDGDGLGDGAEVAAETDPFLGDSDGDLLPDGWEVSNDMDPLDPTDGNYDGDGDGLTLGEEIFLYWTDPLAPDTDNDELDDGAEIMLGTNPHYSDTDGDGCPDGWEVKYGFDPLDDKSPAPNADPDGDNLTNLIEAQIGTNPLTVTGGFDTDGDGLSDGEEYGYVSALPLPHQPFDMSGSTNILEMFNDMDESRVSVALPFPIWPPDAAACSNIVIDINGKIALATDQEEWFSSSPSESRPVIVNAFADDLMAYTNELGSALSVATFGTNGVRRFVVEYRSFGFYHVNPDETNSVSFQVSFAEDEPDVVRVCYFRANPQRSELSDRALGSNAELSLLLAMRRLLHSANLPIAHPGFSLEYHLGTGTSPLVDDCDGDGLLDGTETTLGTNPLQPDTDGDGMGDGWENQHQDNGFNPLVHNSSDSDPNNDGNADPDGDGLTNQQESGALTNPGEPDTDGDGLNDGVEVGQGSDPNDRADTIPVKWVSVTGDLAQGVTKSVQETVTIPAGAMAFVGVFAYSEEYPQYTSQASEYNDILRWGITATGNDALNGMIRVNNEDGAWDMASNGGYSVYGYSPVVLKDRTIYTAPGDADLSVLVELKATNISDGALPSTLIVGFFPLKVAQTNMPDGVGVAGTTDSESSFLRAFIPTNGIAYITGQPAAPQLTAQIKGLPEWLETSWSGTLTTERSERGTLDNRTLAGDTIAGGDVYDITDALDGEIVGGRCVLNFSVRSASAQYPFSIRGKNPLDATARAYIDAHVDAEFQPYAWMIAKHESKSGNRVYNQFNPHDPLKELPNKTGGAGRYGWGIAQIDKQQFGDTTAEVYDWHENVASMNATLRAKRTTVLDFFGYYSSAYSNLPNWTEPPSTNINGHVVSAETWAVLTLYNGAYGIPAQTTPTHNSIFYSPLQFVPSTGQWLFHQNSTNPNYVRDVFWDSAAQETE